MATRARRLPTLRRYFRRVWPVLRVLLSFLLAGVALWILYGHGSELQALDSVFTHLHWWWLPAAVIFEAASFVGFAGMQYRILETGGLRPPMRSLVSMSLATQAINNSFPGGPAFAAVYGFRWYRRFGADDTLAAWSLVGTIVAGTVSLALVAAAGLALAANQGSSLGLIPVLIGVLVATLVFAALFVHDGPLVALCNWALQTAQRVTGHPRGDLPKMVASVVERLAAFNLGWRGMAVAVGWGLTNWIFDCACFAFSFLAVGAGIPWKGLLLAYGAGQLAATLPITPGGLGAVDGSIQIALVAFGGAGESSVAAVFVYRLISFWLVLVAGWAAAGGLALGVRRGRWPRLVRTAPVAPSVRALAEARTAQAVEVGA